jgi:protein-tyrosine phosphatase
MCAMTADLGLPRRILTVCLGNHCRSPFAALVLASRGGAAVEVRSAGLRAKWVDQAAHADMIAAAAEHGFDLREHRGVQVSPDLLAWADIVLAMDRAVLTELGELADAPASAKLALYLENGDVPDPFGQPYDAFTACVAVVLEGAGRHI